MLTSQSSPRPSVFLTVLGIVLFQAATRAQPATLEPVRVEQQGELACGTTERFLRMIFVRTPLARKAKDGESGRTFRVSIRRNDEGLFAGELVVGDAAKPSTESGRRVINGEACSEVFDALALFAALSVDPEASTAPLPEEAVAASAPRVTSSESALATPAPSSVPTARSPGPTQSDGRRSRKGQTTWHARAGAHLGAMSAGLSSPLLLVMPFVETDIEQSSRSAVAFAPAARLWFSSTGGSTRPTVEGPASMHWTTGRLDACPLKIRLLSTLAARPCLSLAGGVLSARGETIAHPSSVRLAWGSVGGLARLEWRFLGGLSLEAMAGIDVPLKRDAFHFDPATPIYRIPAALGYGTAGLGVDFL